MQRTKKLEHQGFVYIKYYLGKTFTLWRGKTVLALVV